MNKKRSNRPFRDHGSIEDDFVFEEVSMDEESSSPAKSRPRSERRLETKRSAVPAASGVQGACTLNDDEINEMVAAIAHAQPQMKPQGRRNHKRGNQAHIASNPSVNPMQTKTVLVDGVKIANTRIHTQAADEVKARGIHLPSGMRAEELAIPSYDSVVAAGEHAFDCAFFQEFSKDGESPVDAMMRKSQQKNSRNRSEPQQAKKEEKSAERNSSRNGEKKASGNAANSGKTGNSEKSDRKTENRPEKKSEKNFEKNLSDKRSEKASGKTPEKSADGRKEKRPENGRRDSMRSSKKIQGGAASAPVETSAVPSVSVPSEVQTPIPVQNTVTNTVPTPVLNAASIPASLVTAGTSAPLSAMTSLPGAPAMDAAIRGELLKQQEVLLHMIHQCHQTLATIQNQLMTPAAPVSFSPYAPVSVPVQVPIPMTAGIPLSPQSALPTVSAAVPVSVPGSAPTPAPVSASVPVSSETPAVSETSDFLSASENVEEGKASEISEASASVAVPASAEHKLSRRERQRLKKQQTNAEMEAENAVISETQEDFSREKQCPDFESKKEAEAKRKVFFETENDSDADFHVDFDADFEADFNEDSEPVNVGKKAVRETRSATDSRKVSPKKTTEKKEKDAGKGDFSEKKGFEGKKSSESLKENREPKEEKAAASPAKTEKTVKTEKSERAERLERPERLEKGEKDGKDGRDEKSEKTEKSGKPSKSPRTVKKDERLRQLQDSEFGKMGLSKELLFALDDAQYATPSRIQAEFIPEALTGDDVMGQAQTGTGKTAAFAIPILELVKFDEECFEPQAMVLVPTRELAVQVKDEFEKLAKYTDLECLALYGGKPLPPQVQQLKAGVDIVIGTPGRVMDHIKRGSLSLRNLKIAVLDEADRMLDIGFRPDIEKILRMAPQSRQTLLLSATIPPTVESIARKYMRDPKKLDCSLKDISSETIEQFYFTVDPELKFDLLLKLIEREKPKQAIIFCRTKRGVERIANRLGKEISSVEAIHGDLQQRRRDRVMSSFRAGKTRFLVATDVVGRGIDVSGISHIINYDIPKFCDDYVHRVGRTGRMGHEGVAFTFVAPEEGNELTRIEMRINRLLQRDEISGFSNIVPPMKTGEIPSSRSSEKSEKSDLSGGEAEKPVHRRRRL